MSERPDAPVVLWDGECGFCRRWIDHWRRLVGDDVAFVPFQEVSEDRLADWELDAVDFETAMHFVDRDDVTHRGAAGVAALLEEADGIRYETFVGLYRNVQAFQLLTDAVYRFIASHRVLAARLTRLFWGEPHRQTFRWGRVLFFRALAVATFIAFWSMWQQVDGLIGAEGILPASDFLERVQSYADARGLGFWERVTRFPTLFWAGASTEALRSACVAGMVGSAALFFGLVPRLVIPGLWSGYLSIMTVGQVFLGYQWDALLLEALFVGWFFAPWQLWPRQREPRDPSWVGRWLVWLVLFKLMFLSGWVKVRADQAWTSLDALDYHFWTQPIPNALAWWADKMPDLFKSAGVAFTLAAEFAAPLLIFAPRRLRHGGALAMIALQVGIGLTGTYGFFNVLTIALCLALFDDRFVEWCTKGLLQPVERTGRRTRWLLPQVAAFLCVATLVMLPFVRSMGIADVKPPEVVRSSRTFNSFGLFARMTKTRPEIGVEVSRDGERWQPVDFRWKPTATDEPLRPTTFHMPRLDWQMWFAALGTCQQNRWFQEFVRHLMLGTDDVERLLDGYDVEQTPPRFVRTPYYEYEFGDERPWTREKKGHYCPTLTLDPNQNLTVAE